MSYSQLHTHLRGNVLESRGNVSVAMPDQDMATTQVTLIQQHITDSGIADAGVGLSRSGDGTWHVHYWRGEWSPWPAPPAWAKVDGPTP